MKRFLLSVTTLGLLLVGVGSIISSCSRTESGASKADSDIAISNFDVNVVSKSAAANYRVALDGDTAYLTMSSTMQWPEKLGSYDIKVFQDSILGLAFPSDKKAGIDASIRSFVADISLLGSTEGVTRVDSIPASAEENVKAYELSVEGRLLEINESMATYQVRGYSFTGGAHPNLTTFPFTYSFDHNVILTTANLFKSGSTEALEGVLREVVARSYNVPVSEITSLGFFSENIPVSPHVCVLDGDLMFHYNAYDIAPYSMGPINICVHPYEVKPYLTELGTSVLLGK